MFDRYAIYFTPKNDFADQGAPWLGWDVGRAVAVADPQISGFDLVEITQTPRKYGFHGTIKPPFHLADGVDRTQLLQALCDFCEAKAPVVLEGLHVSRLGRFLALTPLGAQQALSDLAGAAVTQLDRFRAPPTEQELARRKAKPLTPAQDRNLLAWGYPHVLDEFRFHMTLTGRMQDPQRLVPAATAYFAPCLSQPMIIDSLTLVGQRRDGMFQEIQRVPLTG